MRLLVVCTANISRSPSAAAVLRDAQVPGLEVRSAGTAAVAGAPGCVRAPLLKGLEHTSRPVTAEDLAWADLVITAARDHQPVIVAARPQTRSRMYTIPQVGRLAQWLLDSAVLDVAEPAAVFPAEDPRSRVAPLATTTDRTAWLVTELDAARGLAPAVADAEPARSRRWRRGSAPQVHPDDVPDPHVLGLDWHDAAAQRISEGMAPLVALLGRIQGSGDADDRHEPGSGDSDDRHEPGSGDSDDGHEPGSGDSDDGHEPGSGGPPPQGSS